MALWVCGGESGCGTKYAVGLFRCPRCHNTEFYEDGDPMGKISRHAGASVAEPVPADDTAPDAEAQVEHRGEHGPETVDLPVGAQVFEARSESEGGEGSSLGSSSSVSTEPQPTSSEPSVKSRRKPARTTGSRSGKALTESGSASSTAGEKTDESSTADGSEESS